MPTAPFFRSAFRSARIRTVAVVAAVALASTALVGCSSDPVAEAVGEVGTSAPAGASGSGSGGSGDEAAGDEAAGNAAAGDEAAEDAGSAGSAAGSDPGSDDESAAGAAPDEAPTGAAPDESAAGAAPDEAPAIGALTGAKGEACGALLQFALGRAALMLTPTMAGEQLTEQNVADVFAPLEPFLAEYPPELRQPVQTIHDAALQAVGKTPSEAVEIFESESYQAADQAVTGAMSSYCAGA